MPEHDTYRIGDRHTANDALNELEDDGIALRGVLERHDDVWVLDGEGDRYVQINPAEERASNPTASSAKTMLKQRDRVDVVPIEDAPRTVRDAADGRNPGQNSLAAFAGGRDE